MSAVAYPGTVVRRRIRAVPKRRGISYGKVAGLFVVVGSLTLVLKVVLTFFGFMLIEEARRAASSASIRAGVAETSAIELRREIEILKSEERVVRWASINNFVPSYFASNESAAD